MMINDTNKKMTNFMKKIRFNFLFAILLLLVVGVESNSKPRLVEATLAPPAIKCQVYGADGSLIASCWFCNCRAVASAACGCQM